MSKPMHHAVVEPIDEIGEMDLADLCEATDEAILDGNGFGWLTPPPRHVLEAFWRGVLLVPERDLIVARLDRRIVGSAQLIKPPANNEAMAFAATLSTFFIAPWARGHGLAKGLLAKVEERAQALGFSQLNLDVRATQHAAIRLYEDAGFQCWGIRERYAKVDGDYIPGHFFSKDLSAKRRKA